MSGLIVRKNTNFAADGGGVTKGCSVLTDSRIEQIDRELCLVRQCGRGSVSLIVKDGVYRFIEASAIMGDSVCKCEPCDRCRPGLRVLTDDQVMVIDRLLAQLMTAIKNGSIIMTIDKDGVLDCDSIQIMRRSNAAW